MKKKSLFLAALAALTMATSCSQDEQQSVNRGHAISFNAALDVTRVTDLTTEGLKTSGFWATAVNDTHGTLFENQQFKFVDPVWVSDDKYFWQDYDLKFYAYAPEAKANGFSVDKANLTGFTVKKAVADQIDLVSGHAIGKAADAAKGVEMKLTHALSKITLNVKGTNKAYKCVIKSVSIGNLKNMGNFNIENSSWSNQNGKDVYTYLLDQDVIVDGTQNTVELTPTGGFKLLPQDITAWNFKTDKISADMNGTYICMYIVLTSQGGSEQFKGNTYLPVPNLTWAPNKNYIYTVDFTNGFGYKGGVTDPGDPSKPNPDPKPGVDPDDPVLDTKNPIKFIDVKVTDWEDATQPDISGKTEDK